MIMPSEDTLLLNSPEERVRFREKHYDTVYAYAFDATGCKEQAQGLAERVFAAVERRHESSPIAVQCDSFLAAQVYLMYAQSDLTSLSKVGSYESKSLDLPPLASAPSSAHPFIGLKDSLSTDCAFVSGDADSHAKTPDCAVEGERVQETAASAVSKEPKPSATVPAVPTLCRQELSSDESDDACKASGKQILTAVYDEANTMFWTPGLELEPESEPKGILPQETVWVDEGEMVHRSSFLSVLNGVLVLCSLISIAFLLMELKLLPSLF